MSVYISGTNGLSTNNSTWSGFNSSGYPTGVGLVAFCAYDGSHMSSADTASAKVTPFIYSLYDSHSAYSTSTYRYTVQVAGIYRFSTSWMTHNGWWDRANLRKNNVAIGDQTFAQTTAGAYYRICMDWIIYCEVNDYVEIWRNVIAESSTEIHGGYRHFTGHLISRR